MLFNEELNSICAVSAPAVPLNDLKLRKLYSVLAVKIVNSPKGKAALLTLDDCGNNFTVFMPPRVSQFLLRGDNLLKFTESIDKGDFKMKYKGTVYHDLEFFHKKDHKQNKNKIVESEEDEELDEIQN